jgi:hypothetical protein
VDDVNSFNGELPNQALPTVTVHLIKKPAPAQSRSKPHEQAHLQGKKRAKTD